MSKTRKKFDRLIAQADARRRAHFEQGGDIARWRGRSTIFKSRRRRLQDKAAAQDMRSDD
jgi:hypothetical protein